MTGSGILLEAFDISGRGTVVVLEEFDGQARAGDVLVIGPTPHKIAGVELVSFRSVEAYERNRQLRRVGLLIAGCSTQELEAYKGQRLEIEFAPRA